jgi:hypothetical protein
LQKKSKRDERGREERKQRKEMIMEWNGGGKEKEKRDERRDVEWVSWTLLL